MTGPDSEGLQAEVAADEDVDAEGITATGPVATPTEPGRQLRVMEAHRLENCGDRAACWYVAHRAGLRTVAEQDGQR